MTVEMGGKKYIWSALENISQSELKGPLERHKRKLEYNIEMGFEETGYWNMDWVDMVEYN
jgi:hypothetical protein